jgi:hypothetical protein
MDQKNRLKIFLFIKLMIEERNFVSLKRTLPGMRELEYLGLAQPYFN